MAAYSAAAAASAARRRAATSITLTPRFSPPYLFNADDSLATRPTIEVSQDVAVNGDTVTVTGNVPLSMVSIIRLGSATHTVDSDQRRIELCGPTAGACGGAANDVTIPADPGVAIAGNWMVFGLDAAGVPSESALIKIGAPAAVVADVAAAPRADAQVVSAEATPADAVARGGTAAPVVATFEATPANPDLPMPPGTQLD